MALAMEPMFVPLPADMVVPRVVRFPSELSAAVSYSDAPIADSPWLRGVGVPPGLQSVPSFPSEMPAAASYSDAPIADSPWLRGVGVPLGLQSVPSTKLASNDWERKPREEIPKPSFGGRKTCSGRGDELLRGQESASVATKFSSKGQGGRWWMMCPMSLTCPLTGFPICLLPYPPFKMRTLADKPHPQLLVDGKYLAMSFIAFGSDLVNGRRLEDTEITALGQYMHRCKLGPFRPRIALDLARDAANPDLSPEQRRQAAQELSRLRATAKSQLGKIQSVQGNRLAQLRQEMLVATEEVADSKDKNASMRSDSKASTCSGQSSEAAFSPARSICERSA